jgi:hypothetical protein
MLEAFKEILSALDNYGPVAVVLVGLALMNGFFIWRDFRREAHQQKQLEELQRIHNDLMVPLLGECKEVIASCRVVIEQNSTIILNLVKNAR